MKELLSTESDGILTLTLNRPEKRNALNDALIGALKDEFAGSQDTKDLRAIVLKGSGKDFCSGADLSALRKIADNDEKENLEDAKSLMDLFLSIRHAPVPVVAAVHGRALAGGCGLATACDLVVAAESARFGYPEVKIGFVPAMVMAILRRNLGEKLAFEIATRGFEFSAAEARTFGLINRVYSDESFEEETEGFVGEYRRLSSSAVRLSKQLLYRMDAQGFEEALSSGAEVNAMARKTEDFRAGIEKFLGKTK